MISDVTSVSSLSVISPIFSQTSVSPIFVISPIYSPSSLSSTAAASKQDEGGEELSTTVCQLFRPEDIYSFRLGRLWGFQDP